MHEDWAVRSDCEACATITTGASRSILSYPAFPCCHNAIEVHRRGYFGMVLNHDAHPVHNHSCNAPQFFTVIHNEPVHGLAVVSGWSK